MMELWLRISYMVQILAACFIFINCMPKRSYFWVKVIGYILGMCMLSYWVTSRWGTTELDINPARWVIYFVAAILFMWFLLECNFLEAVFVGSCACGIQHMAYDLHVTLELVRVVNEWPMNWIQNIGGVVIYIGVYGSVYYFLVRSFIKSNRIQFKKNIVIPIVSMIVIVWGISLLEISELPEFYSSPYNHMLYRFIDFLCCFYVIWVQFIQIKDANLQKEMDGIHTAWKQQIKQYEFTSETINRINLKCHDLKHQIQKIREIEPTEERDEYLKEIENDIMIYDTAINTGNDALDIVLRENALYCKENNIHWTCMADGRKLNFMKMEDVYAICGNALDNAIQAVEQIFEEEKRVISVKIIEYNSLLMIQIENTYEQALEFINGLPVTTKKDKENHGYGMKSIQFTVQKYNGVVTVQAFDEIFKLQILIPIPENK